MKQIVLWISTRLPSSDRYSVLGNDEVDGRDDAAQINGRIIGTHVPSLECGPRGRNLGRHSRCNFSSTNQPYDPVIFGIDDLSFSSNRFL